MSLKKLGIDAKWHFSGPPSGIVVVKNLLYKFLKLENEFHVFLFIRKDEKELFESLIQKEFANSKIDLITVVGNNNFLQNLFIVPGLAKRHKIDLMVYLSYPPLLFRGKSKNIVFILDLLDLDFPQYFGVIEKVVFKLRNLLVPSVYHVITISHSEKERINRHINTYKDKISVVHLGVNENFRLHHQNECERIREKYKLPEKFILYIGRLNVRKNIPTLIEALKKVNNTWPLVLIGSKDGKSFDIDSKLHELGLDSRVIFLGFVEERDMAAILSAATIFCYPSFAEGFGLPPLEAMKSGTPVITTNSTSIPEVCGDAVSYFDPNSAEDLGAKLDKLAQDENLRDILRQKGLERVANFTWDKAALTFRNIIRKEI